MTTSATTGSPPRKKQLILGLIAMMAISSPQYVWALFTQHLTTTLGASLAEVQVTFSILIVLQTFLSPLQGFLIDRFGPHRLLAIGAALTGLSWIVSSDVQTLTGLYLSYGVLGGIGTGVVYVGVIGLMVQWFPDLRGFATGMVAAGYGFGAVLTTFPISSSLKAEGFQQTLFTYGIVIGLGRTPVREALQRLAAEGAVQILPRAGIIIAQVDFTDQFRLIEVRRELERLLAGRAAREADDATQAAFADLAKRFSKAASSDDAELFIDTDREFNHLVEATANNKYAQMAMSAIQAQTRRFWYLYFSRFGDLKEVAQRHADIAEAIAAGKEEEARMASDALIDYVEGYTRKTLEALCAT